MDSAHVRLKLDQRGARLAGPAEERGAAVLLDVRDELVEAERRQPAEQSEHEHEFEQEHEALRAG